MSRVWLAIVVSGAGTYAMRASFLAAAHRLAHVPPGAARVLRQIPPAALAALVVPALVRPEGQLDLLQPRLLAGMVAALVAWRTRNVGVTLVLGMAMLVALEAVWG
ncbi:MAG TPA: AzlD domain-containing protein [Acidimicrobiales bacterium]|nr:AzlD domain-containing protein [Acidimicrobiales bacterium]